MSDPDPDDWDAAFAEELLGSQEDAEAVAEACDMMADTSSDEESSSSVSAGFASPWWARVLFQSVQRIGHAWPKGYGKTSDPVQLVSGCTGCCAEAAVLKVGGVFTPTLSNWFSFACVYMFICVLCVCVGC